MSEFIATLFLALMGGAGALLAAVAWVYGRGYQDGWRDATETTNRQNAERLERQNKVAARPVSDAQLDKSLKDGTF